MRTAKIGPDLRLGWTAHSFSFSIDSSRGWERGTDARESGTRMMICVSHGLRKKKRLLVV